MVVLVALADKKRKLLVLFYHRGANSLADSKQEDWTAEQQQQMHKTTSINNDIRGALCHRSHRATRHKTHP